MSTLIKIRSVFYLIMTKKNTNIKGLEILKINKEKGMKNSNCTPILIIIKKKNKRDT